jgi:hypothetical protein
MVLYKKLLLNGLVVCVDPDVVQVPSQTYITPVGATNKVPVVGDAGNENAIL